MRDFISRAQVSICLIFIFIRFFVAYVSWDVELLLDDFEQDRDNNFPILVLVMVAEILIAMIEGLKP